MVSGQPAPRSVRDLAWLAGLLEGEGYFGLQPGKGRKRFYPRLILAMTDYDVVAKAAAIGRVGHVRPRPKQAEHHQDSWAWEVTNQRDAIALMLTLFPFLGARRRDKVRKCVLAWRSQAGGWRFDATGRRYAA